ncbi:U7 snRNA-associated Sm-like protein LSm10 [Phymastichus coffea]|uniref:U7 snRNA-associated Sm-like protein LSm10 n=1 Tax=Phymastichus coffea TaxID=108790 RepID=UPI00273C65FD|nr:U7 snRNA-associated Sm-like protein LSm10 [Phymastichus coffea]
MNTYFSDRKERHLLYNTLAILLKAVEGERTTVDLRNEACIYGTVEQADGFMNILMKNCIFTDPKGDSFKYEIFFVQARNIRQVHIPAHIRILPSIKEQLEKVSRRPVKNIPTHSLRSKRITRNQAEGLAAVKKILEDRKHNEPQASGSGTKN